MAKQPPKLSEQLRQAIRSAATRPAWIARDTGLSPMTLSFFLRGRRGLSVGALDAIGAYLDLRITPGPRYPTAKPGKPAAAPDAKRGARSTPGKGTRQRQAKGHG